MTNLFLDTDHVVELSNAKDNEGNVLDSASIEVTVQDMQGEEISGATWPLSMSAVDSNGNYKVTLPAAINIVENKYYQVLVQMTAPYTASWLEVVKAIYRGF